ncbi:MAG: phage minor capsid protein [Lachnospiraceae bacterium]|nr:phage minor capsid protein [Lachnospiraceae bacterium]
MSPEEMEKLPKKLEKIFSNLELDVMGDIVERLKETKAITPAIDWMLLRMTAVGKSKNAIKKAIQKALALAEKEIEKIYNTAAEALFTRSAEIYREVGRDFIPLQENKEVLQLIEAIKSQTSDEMTNITRTTGFMTRDKQGNRIVTPAAEFFQQKLDQAIIEIDTGVYDYNTSIQKVIDEMTTSGLRTVEYDSGRTDRIEVAARRAVMTGNSQLTDKVNEKNAEKLGTEYWEVAWHMGARNTGTGFRNHQSWQGKVYSSEEMKTVCGLGEMLGFGGINCYHIRYPFIMGVSKRNYTDEWLEEQNKIENTKKVYRGKEYDTYSALQHQRKLERTMRKQNQDIQLLDKADADPDMLMAARSRRKATEREYIDFSKQMGLRQQRERLAAPKSVSKSTEKAVAKLDNSDIMELQRKVDDSRKNFKFITDETFNNLTITARKKGAVIIRGTKEAEEHLEKLGASAANIGDVLIFKKDVCISEVLEETYHFEQNISKMNDDKGEPLRSILNEIDAKQYLLDNADKYRIPRNEIELTERQLKSYKQQLEEYQKGGK